MMTSALGATSAAHGFPEQDAKRFCLLRVGGGAGFYRTTKEDNATASSLPHRRLWPDRAA
jgi:hypothetical protein